MVTKGHTWLVTRCLGGSGPSVLGFSSSMGVGLASRLPAGCLANEARLGLNTAVNGGLRAE